MPVAPSSIEQATQLFAAICFLVIGVSHLVQARGWVAFYQALAARGTPGVFLEGFLCLNVGAFIAAFHNVWSWPAIGLTLIGWAQVVKGMVRFIAPAMALRTMQRITPERAWTFQVGGVVSLLLSAYTWWLALRA